MFSSQDFDEYITDGITASVQNYIIHVAPEINVTLEANDSAVCSRTSCKYDYYQVKTETLDYYEVSITTKNLLTDGYSETQVCSSTMISKNQIIMVMMNRFHASAGPLIRGNDTPLFNLQRNFSDVEKILSWPLTRFEGTAFVFTALSFPCMLSYTQ